MKISLRKAHALQLAINSALKELDFTEYTTISEFQNVNAEVTKTFTKFTTEVETRSALLDALYEIRGSVAAASSGTDSIDSKLNKLARIEKDIVFYTSLTKQPVAQDEAILTQMLKKIKDSPTTESPYGLSSRSSTVTAHVITEEMSTDYKTKVSELKRQKQKLQDSLLEANVSTTIALSTESEVTLRNQGIID